jgi:predicted enzyme related to lactoylglutathione lyase
MMNRRVFVMAIAAMAFVACNQNASAGQAPAKPPGTGEGAKRNAGGRTMLDKVVYISVFVKDQDKALDFYTNVLGFEKRVDVPYPDGPRFLTVGLKGQDFQLILWPGTPGQGQPFQGRPPAQYTIATADCRKAYELLKSRGVKFDTDVLEYPWGYVAVFQDPDGNRLQLRQGR